MFTYVFPVKFCVPIVVPLALVKSEACAWVLSEPLRPPATSASVAAARKKERLRGWAGRPGLQGMGFCTEGGLTARRPLARL
jgi:hypothetical protein